MGVRTNIVKLERNRNYTKWPDTDYCNRGSFQNANNQMNIRSGKSGISLFGHFPSFHPGITVDLDYFRSGCRRHLCQQHLLWLAGRAHHHKTNLKSGDNFETDEQAQLYINDDLHRRPNMQGCERCVGETEDGGNGQRENHQKISKGQVILEIFPIIYAYMHLWGVQKQPSSEIGFKMQYRTGYN